MSSEREPSPPHTDATALPAPLTTRRAFVRRATQASVALAATGPVASLLAACGSASTARALPTATSTTAPTPTATPDTRPITIAITGDVMLSRSVGAQLLATSDRFPFNGVADWLSGFDITVGKV